MSGALEIRYGGKADHTRLLGPGDRAVLYTYGCCFDCPGCVARSFRFGESFTASPEELVDWFLATGAEGLTISGGEPFLQAEALAEMVRRIRERRDVGVIVYTGFLAEDLEGKARTDPGVRDFLARVDLLIDGPYRQEEDHNEPFRGSANQRLLLRTDRYQDALAPYYLETRGRKIEITANDHGSMMVGVPSRDQLAFWRSMNRHNQEEV